MSPGRTLAVGFLVWIAGVPVVEALHFAAEGLPHATDHLDLEDQLEERSWLRRTTLPWTQRGFLTLGAGNESVVIGRDGWLFFRNSVEHVVSRRFAGRGSAAAAIADFARQLGALGIELVVVPVPAKVSICGEHLAANAGGVTPRRELALHRELRELGIDSIDPTPVLAALADAYLPTDTHWTPAGVEHVAELLADELAERGLAARTTPEDTDVVPVSHHGDLAVALGTALHSPEAVTVRPRRESDEPCEIMLLGDSFANIYSLEAMGFGTRAGLAEQLDARLDAGVESIAINDHGAHATREELRRRRAQGTDPLKGKRVVIFQFAARELTFGDWRLVDLGPVGAGRGGPDRLTVEATVAARAALPEPTATPYADVVFALHLTGVTGGLTEDAVVFAFGIKARQRTPLGDVVVGRRVRLELIDWAEVADSHGRLCRVELDDPELWSLATFWGEPLPRR